MPRSRKVTPVTNDTNIPAESGRKGKAITLKVEVPPEIASLPLIMQQQFTGALQELLDAAVADFIQPPAETETEGEEAQLYVFKIWLKGSKRIYRRLALPDLLTLDDLHEVIFSAFDRYDPHLYSFFIGEPGSSKRERRGFSTEYSAPIRSEQFGETADMFGNPIHNAAKVRLRDLNLKVGQVFEYLFDFGDDWEHEIEVEELDRKPDGGPYPRILEKRGESPAQYPDFDDEEDFE